MMFHRANLLRLHERSIRRRYMRLSPSNTTCSYIMVFCMSHYVLVCVVFKMFFLNFQFSGLTVV